MAIQIPQGYIIRSPEAIDDRLVMSKAQMREMSRDYNLGKMPPVYITLCTDKDGDNYNLYIFSRDNSESAETGKFKAYSGS